MSNKNPRSGKGAAASASCSKPSKTAPASDNQQEEEDEELPLIWQKMSDKLLQSINERFDKFERNFESLFTAQQALAERLSTTESQATDHELRITAMESSISDLRHENVKLRAKLLDLEGRSRRNNIKIVGVPEGEEKGRPTEFVTNIIPKLLGGDNFDKPVVIDRAHRIPQPRPPDDARPRTIIARVHFAQDKEKILRLGRQTKMDLGGHRILIFPDYTAEVMEQRRGFRGVLQLLREKEIQHSLRFPARLQVHHQGQVKTFTDPAEAKSFIT